MNQTQYFSELQTLRQMPKSEAFWSDYLRIVCGICSADTGLILSPGPEQIQVDAVFNPKEHANSLMEQLAESGRDMLPRVREKGCALEKIRTEVPELQNVIAYETQRSQTPHLIILALGPLPSRALNELLIRTRLLAMISEENLPDTGETREQGMIGSSLEVISQLLKAERFQLASMSLVNDLCSRFQVSRVSLGWHENPYIKIQAISHLERFDSQTEACVRLANAMEESLDQNEEILCPGHEDPGTIQTAHQQFLSQCGAFQVISLPLRFRDEPAGVLTIEKASSRFHPQEIMALRLIANQSAPVLARLHADDQWAGERLKNYLKDKVQWLLGPENSFAKLLALIGFASVLFLTFGTWDYDVEVGAELKTDLISYISSPMDGVILNVLAHSGDTVTKGQTLIQIDTEEIHLKITEAQAEVTRYERETQKARADGRLADMNISEARLAQAKAELERVRFYLNRADLKAPQDGVIVEGEKEKLMGAPINKGDLLYQIAQPEAMYLILKVPERDIDEITVPGQGEMALLSNPQMKYPFEIETLVPVARVDPRSGNTFELKARFVESPESWWRPGMSGLARIKAGRRSVGWILFHRITDTMRLYLWW